MNQLEKILIAYDGSSYADEALKELRRAGLPAVAEALILMVAEPLSSFEAMGVGMGGFHTEVAQLDAAHKLEQSRGLAHQACERLRSYFPKWNLLPEAAEGAPAATVIAKAEDWGANLIVVGSRAATRLGELLIGSVSKKIAAEAECSVRVARHTELAQGAPACIVIGVDGSSGSSAAVNVVLSRTWSETRDVRLVTAVEPFHQYGLTPTEKFASATTAQETAAAKLRAAGFNVTSVIEVEKPQTLLLRVAENWKADCIFLGARKLSGLGRLMLGSVSTAVVARAHCSVEVVRGTH